MWLWTLSDRSDRQLIVCFRQCRINYLATFFNTEILVLLSYILMLYFSSPTSPGSRISDFSGCQYFPFTSSVGCILGSDSSISFVFSDSTVTVCSCTVSGCSAGGRGGSSLLTRGIIGTLPTCSGGSLQNAWIICYCLCYFEFQTMIHDIVIPFVISHCMLYSSYFWE